MGDTLWALMMYWIIAFFFPNMNIQKVALFSLCICFLVEFSQLIQIDWMNTIRNNRFGALVLGKGFLWSDFIAYSLGIGLGVTIENYLKKLR